MPTSHGPLHLSHARAKSSSFACRSSSSIVFFREILAVIFTVKRRLIGGYRFPAPASRVSAVPPRGVATKTP